jgi:ATP-dependent Clp protease ATP-binding subunit ClpC
MQGYSDERRAWGPWGVFERFTEPARHVVVLAQQESRGLGHNYIGTEHILLALREALDLGQDCVATEHLLLGLVREDDGLAVQILLDLDADLEKIRKEVRRILPAIIAEVILGTAAIHGIGRLD